jgi:hypothetical protein
MKLRRCVCLAATGAVIFLSAAQAVSAAVIGGWDFQNQPAGVLNINPAPSVNNQNVGTPMAIPLGMWNTYTLSGSGKNPAANGSIDGQDLTVTNGSTTNLDPNNLAWRVRGDTGNVYPDAQLLESNPGLDNPSVGNGWSNSAPQYTQGAQFNFNTTGYSNLVFSYDWFSTNQGIRDQAIQYTTDGTNWTTVGATGVGSGGIIGTSIAVNTGGLVYNINNANDFVTGITVDFNALGIHTFDNDPNFGVRLVSIYDPTYNGPGSAGFSTIYTASSAGTGTPNTVNGIYNNNSGNWRYDNVFLSTATVPEPSSMFMATLGLITLAGCACRQRKQRFLSSPAQLRSQK